MDPNEFTYKQKLELEQEQSALRQEHEGNLDYVPEEKSSNIIQEPGDDYETDSSLDEETQPSTTSESSSTATDTPMDGPPLSDLESSKEIMNHKNRRGDQLHFHVKLKDGTTFWIPMDQAKPEELARYIPALSLARYNPLIKKFPSLVTYRNPINNEG